MKAAMLILCAIAYTSAYGHDLTGEASIYNHGYKTASGERFNTKALTAAHFSLPFNTLVLVTNQANGKSAVVRINDRGPFHVTIRNRRIVRVDTRRPHQKFVVDLTPGAASDDETRACTCETYSVGEGGRIMFMDIVWGIVCFYLGAYVFGIGVYVGVRLASK